MGVENVCLVEIGEGPKNLCSCGDGEADTAGHG